MNVILDSMTATGMQLVTTRVEVTPVHVTVNYLAMAHTVMVWIYPFN